MAQSYLMEAEYGFGSLNFSELECFSSADSIFRDQFFFGKNELETPLNMSDFENRIHDGIKPNINSDENEILNTRDVNRSPNRPDVTEETDYNTTIKFEPDDITEEIVIPVPPSAVIPQSTKVEKQEHIPICDAQVEIETTKAPISTTPGTLVPGFFIIQPVTSTSNVTLLSSSATPVIHVPASGKCGTKKVENPMFNLNNIKPLKPTRNSSQKSTRNKRSIDELNDEISILVSGENNVEELSYQQEQIVKRKLRMIKNRESAFLSRERKKEYIGSLEQKIDELQRQNDALKSENVKLKDQLEQQRQINDTVWLPKRFAKRTNKKVATVMLSILLMVAFNVFRTLPQTEINADNNENANVPRMLHHGRSLLWTKESESYSSKEPIHPDSSVWINNTLQMKCPIHINQTESMRIDSDLRKWIGADKQRAIADNITGLRSKVDSNKKKIDITLSKLLRGTRTRQLYGEYSDLSSDISSSSDEEIEFFGLRNELLLDDSDPLYRAMDRQRDTFYFVSFSEDHIVLPAITHNITISPKMSLLLPSTIINESLSSSDVVTMMQIDCAVTDTRLLRVKEKDIPSYLKANFLKTNQRNDNSSSAYRKGTKNKFRPSLRSTKSYNIHLPNNMRK